MPLGSVTKQSLLHQHWISYWCFDVKLLQINYNNQKVAVELVTYWDPCIDWLVTYLEPCIERGDCHYITSLIGYWGKGSIVGWYKILGFILLVTACFDNSGFSGVVTLNLLGGVFPWWFFSFVNKPPVSNLFSAAFSYLVICLCYHTYCMLIDLINSLS